MDRPLVISDRLTAAGFRLAGMSVLVTKPDQAQERFRQAMTQDAPVLITAELAACVPAAEIEQAVIRARPPVSLIADLSGHLAAPDMTSRVRRALGVDT